VVLFVSDLKSPMSSPKTPHNRCEARAQMSSPACSNSAHSITGRNTSRSHLAAFFFVVFLGCGDSSPGPDARPDAGVADADAGSNETTQARSTGLVALTGQQIENAVEALLGDATVQITFAPRRAVDSVISGVGMSSLFAEELEEKLSVSARKAMADPAQRAQLVPCEPTESECRRQSLQRFMRRAWRRPAQPEEVDRYLAVAEAWRPLEPAESAGLGSAFAGVLLSPHFLYNARNVSKEANASELSLYAASRLALFLWNSIPDEELLELGIAGRLTTPEAIEKQVDRMLTSPQFRVGVIAFFRTFLGLNGLADIRKRRADFPTFNEHLSASMQEEIERVVLDKLVDKGLPYSDLFRGQETFVNEALAAHYGIPFASGAEGDSFQSAVWPSNEPRQGVLGFAGILTLRSSAGGTSPTQRGLFVRNHVLCQTVPPPPRGDVTVLEPVPPGVVMSTRERLARHAEDPQCAACHDLMDPIGFSLQNFDAVGAYRTEESGLPIDASGFLDATAFDNAAGLSDAVASHPRLAPCLAEHMFLHIAGHGSQPEHKDMLNALSAEFIEAGQNVPRLMASFAKHKWFWEPQTAEPLGGVQ